MIELLQHGFMQRALIGGILIAVLCSIVGVFLVLRRLSLLGDGLAHLAFGGIALGLLLGIPPIISALFFTGLGSIGVQKLIRKAHIYGESATALVLSFGVGLGVIIIGMAKGFNVDLFSYLFGSILAMSNLDILVISLVFMAVVLFIVAFYRKLVLVTFNEDLARISGIRIDAVDYVFAILTALTIVITIRAVGILLISALLVIPALAALQFSKSFRGTLIHSIIFSMVSVSSGIILSFYANLPTSGSIVMIMCGLFLLTILFRNKYGAFRNI